MNDATGFEIQVQQALKASLLDSFPAEARVRLLRDARRVDVAADSALFLGARAPQPALLVEGLLRVYITSPDGKQVTITYVKPGGCVGIVALAGKPPPITIQTLIPSVMLVFDAETVKEIVHSDPTAAWAISVELARVVHGMLDQLAHNVFGTIRQRVGNHLLSLAAPVDGRLVVPALTHQELANAVGTAREVASRTMAELVRAGLVTSAKDGIVITDPERLLNEVGMSAST